jgi:hypothetical protein
MPDEKNGRRAKYKKIGRSVDYGPLVTVALETYLESRYLIDCGNISACNPDPQARKPMKLFAHCERVANVENAVRSVLKTQYQQDCFDQILKEIAGTAPVDAAFSPGLRVEVTQKVGREFERRRIRGSSPTSCGV